MQAAGSLKLANPHSFHSVSSNAAHCDHEYINIKPQICQRQIKMVGRLVKQVMGLTWWIAGIGIALRIRTHKAEEKPLE